MGITLKELIGLTKELPEEALEEAYEALKGIKEKAESEKESKPIECLGCGSVHVVRNGKQNGRQLYLNGFHSFIKERLDAARGVATIYLNRYNTWFSQIYADQDAAVDKIYELMTTRNGSFSDIATVKSQSLLSL